MATLPQAKSDSLWKHLDKKEMSEFELFYTKVNERSEFFAGYRTSYVAPTDALGETVEYFHPTITYDDRMRYICQYIVTNPKLSEHNKICNTIISHFYGARGIHQVLSGIDDPNMAHVNFDTLAKEQTDYKNNKIIGPYTNWIRKHSLEQKEAGLPFWGTTELHTSLQSAGRKFVNNTYGTTDKGTPANVAEWIASWINVGIIDTMLQVKSLEELYNTFIKINGVGPYYAYHGAASNSNNPSLKAYHDERFCDPGSGAKETSTLFFPGLSPKDVSLADRVIWIRENQLQLMNTPAIHKDRYNITSNGVIIYPEDQSELKTYGTEVAMCQFSVYKRLKANPHLIKHRKVARIEAKSNINKLLEF